MEDPDNNSEGIRFRDIMRNNKQESQNREGCSYGCSTSKPASQPKAEKQMKSDGTQHAMKRILFVDDDFSNRHRCRLWLERNAKGKCEMIESEDAITALGMLKNEYFNLVMVDSMLPDIGCIEFIGRARAIINERGIGTIPFILMNELMKFNDIELQRLPVDSRPDAVIHKSYSGMDVEIIERLFESPGTNIKE